MGAVTQNWLILQKFHLNQNCRVSKSKIIMWRWFLEGQESCKVAANIFHGFDCTKYVVLEYSEANSTELVVADIWALGYHSIINKPHHQPFEFPINVLPDLVFFNALHIVFIIRIDIFPAKSAKNRTKCLNILKSSLFGVFSDKKNFLGQKMLANSLILELRDFPVL